MDQNHDFFLLFKNQWMKEKGIISESYMDCIKIEWKTSQNTIKGPSVFNHKEQISQHSFLTKTISKAEE